MPLTDSATDVPLWTQKVTSLRNAHHGNFLRFSRTLSSPWTYAERLLFSFPFGRSQSCQAIEVHAAGEKFGHLRMQKRFSLYNEFTFPFSMFRGKCKCFVSSWRVLLPVYTSLYSAASESAPCLLQGVMGLLSVLSSSRHCAQALGLLSR